MIASMEFLRLVMEYCSITRGADHLRRLEKFANTHGSFAVVCTVNPRDMFVIGGDDLQVAACEDIMRFAHFDH